MSRASRRGPVVDESRINRVRAAVAGTLLVALAACSPSVPVDGASSSPGPGGSSSGIITPHGTIVVPSAAVTPSPSPSASLPGSSSPDAVGWQQSPDQPAFHDSAMATGMTSVIWTGSVFLATNILAQPLLFDSVDGRTWDRQPPFQTSGDTSGPRLVAAGPGGVVAVGGGNGGRLSIWHSSDGLTWTAAPDQPAFRSHDGSFEDISGVSASNAGWVAVGGESYNSTGPSLLRAVVLTSPDGLQWTREPDAPALERATMNAIARTASGFVAVGSVIGASASGDAELHPAVWTSPDGRTWSMSTDPPTFAIPGAPAQTAFQLRGVAVQGHRMVTVGWMTSRSPNPEIDVVSTSAVAWWSDGGAWTPARVGVFEFGRSVTIADAPGRFVVFTDPNDSCGGGIWGSPDGESWTCDGTDPAFDDASVTGVAASADIEVLVGSTNLPDGSSTAAAWTRPLP
jgi:hypothetical protein